MIAMTVAQRRDLDSERQSRETEDQKRARQDTVAKKEAIKAEVSSTLRPFYCALCDKQYLTAPQFDEHVRSYAHTHKQVLRGPNTRITAQTDPPTTAFQGDGGFSASERQLQSARKGAQTRRKGAKATGCRFGGQAYSRARCCYRRHRPRGPSRYDCPFGSDRWRKLERRLG